jgi:iron complex transport system ATP-binding protein
VQNLSITLSGNEILKGVSLTVQEGEYVSIIGPNGAGKTTLIKCLAGIHKGWSGQIMLAGKPFVAYTSRERARLQSYVPQAEGRTNPMTVEAFVALGRYPHLSAFTTMNSDDRRAVNGALELAGLLDLRHRKISTLSGGERQMAFIAAALAQETKLLLLDEPATFLDYRHQHNVADILKSASRENGISVVAVHHDINTATASSDRIYAIKGGRIVFSGTAEETANPDTLKEIYETEFISAPSPHRPLPFIMSGGAK